MLNNLRSAELQKIMDHELTTGNHIAGEESGWSEMRMVIRFRGSLDRPFAENLINKSDGRLRSFINRGDPHNGVSQYGVICEDESLVGPL